MIPEAAPDPVTPADLSRAVRLLLGGQLAPGLAAHLGGTWDDFRRGLATSDAFDRQVIAPALAGEPFPPGLAEALDLETAVWAALRLGAKGVRDGAEAAAVLLGRVADAAPRDPRVRLWRYAADRLRAPPPGGGAAAAGVRAVFAEALRESREPRTLAEADQALRRMDRRGAEPLTRAEAAEAVDRIAAPPAPQGGGPNALVLLTHPDDAAARLIAELGRRARLVVVSRDDPARLAGCGAAILGPAAPRLWRDPPAMQRLAGRLAQAYAPLFCVACGAGAGALALGLHAEGVPCLLIADAAAPQEAGALRELFAISDATGFPDAAAAAEAEAAFPELALRRRLPPSPGADAGQDAWESYALHLAEQGLAAGARATQARRDEAVLAPADAFDPHIYFAGAFDGRPRGEAVRLYLDRTRQVDFSRPPPPGVAVRRPAPGFHPMLYAAHAGGDRDPFAHFLEHGRPPGPWLHEVIGLDTLDAPRSSPPLTVAVHGHFHYTDHLGDFLRALTRNRACADLFLTTTSEAAAGRLAEATADYAGGRVVIAAGPNLGRNLAPFIRVLEAHVLDRYDVVGHLHGKRSLQASESEAGVGDRWRDFLWRHLLGPDLPVLDMLLERFAADPALGLVFPEHAVAMGWDRNAAIARDLAPRLGLSEPPAHIEFPVGAMFWARPDALRPLVRAGFGPEDFPPEPVPIDGTVLHALERMFVLVAEGAGFRYATTYRPGVTR